MYKRQGGGPSIREVSPTNSMPLLVYEMASKHQSPSSGSSDKSSQYVCVLAWDHQTPPPVRPEQLGTRPTTVTPYLLLMLLVECCENVPSRATIPAAPLPVSPSKSYGSPRFFTFTTRRHSNSCVNIYKPYLVHVNLMHLSDSSSSSFL